MALYAKSIHDRTPRQKCKILLFYTSTILQSEVSPKDSQLHQNQPSDKTERKKKKMLIIHLKKHHCPLSSVIPHIISNKTNSHPFYPIFSINSHLVHNILQSHSAKLRRTAHLRQNSVFLKPIIYPISGILHKQRSRRS